MRLLRSARNDSLVNGIDSLAMTRYGWDCFVLPAMTT